MKQYSLVTNYGAKNGAMFWNGAGGWTYSSSGAALYTDVHSAENAYAKIRTSKPLNLIENFGRSDERFVL